MEATSCVKRPRIEQEQEKHENAMKAAERNKELFKEFKKQLGKLNPNQYSDDVFEELKVRCPGVNENEIKHELMMFVEAMERAKKNMAFNDAILSYIDEMKSIRLEGGAAVSRSCADGFNKEGIALPKYYLWTRWNQLLLLGLTEEEIVEEMKVPYLEKIERGLKYMRAWRGEEEHEEHEEGPSVVKRHTALGLLQQYANVENELLTEWMREEIEAAEHKNKLFEEFRKQLGELNPNEYSEGIFEELKARCPGVDEHDIKRELMMFVEAMERAHKNMEFNNTILSYIDEMKSMRLKGEAGGSTSCADDSDKEGLPPKDYLWWRWNLLLRYGLTEEATFKYLKGLYLKKEEQILKFVRAWRGEDVGDWCLPYD